MSDPDDHDDVEATLEAGITQGGEAEKPDTPLTCPHCSAELIQQIQGTPTWFCECCSRTFRPTKRP